MILTELRDAMLTQIQAAVPSLKEVKPHGGRFSLEELKAASVRSPSVRVACLGFQDISASDGGATVNAVWGAFIIAGDQAEPRLSRDSAALAIAGALSLLIPDNCWGKEEAVDGAKNVKAENLFSREIEKNGIALWAVTWRQDVDLAAEDLSGLDDFLRCHVDWDINQDGEVDATDDIELPQ